MRQSNGNVSEGGSLIDFNSAARTVLSELDGPQTIALIKNNLSSAFQKTLRPLKFCVFSLLRVKILTCLMRLRVLR